MQYCNGKEKQPRNPGSTLNFNFSRGFLFSGEIRIEKVNARGKVCQQTALCHEYIAGTERDLYLKLTRSSLFPNNKQYSIHVTCSLSLLT